MEKDVKVNRPRKNDLRTLGYLPKFQLDWPILKDEMEKGVYSFTLRNMEYDFIYKPSKKNLLFVMLSGNADRARLSPPIFQRWSWASQFPGHCLYIADPTLKLHDDLGIAWYIGTKEENILPVIAEIIVNVAKKINIPMENVILYASSGGAFASLALSALIPGVITVAINPQIDVAKYGDEELLNKFLGSCFEGLTPDMALQRYPERFSIIHSAQKLTNQRILYVQNKLDPHHYHVHFPLFAEEMGLNETNNFKNNGIETLLFEHPGGHNSGETPEIFQEIMNRMILLTEEKKETTSPKLV